MNSKANSKKSKERHNRHDPSLMKETKVNRTRSSGRHFSRREFLRLGATVGAGIGTAALPFARVHAADPLLMRTIPHGKEALPAVGIGTAIVFDIAEDAQKRAERSAVIRIMLEGGARVIDTAPSYGSAEDVVGDLLAALGVRERIFLATKVRLASREDAIAEMRRSLVRLRTPQVDLIQLHNVREANTDLGVLREWRDQGYARYIGVTSTQASTYDSVAEVVRREKPDFLQVGYSLSERQAEARLLPVAAESGAAVLTALPFGRGRLFSAVRGKSLPEWAGEFGATSWAQFFLKYLLSNETVTCVIPGTDKAEYMTDNLNAARGRLPDAKMRKRMVQFWESLA